MTSYELANQLLRGEDLPVILEWDDCHRGSCVSEVASAEVRKVKFISEPLSRTPFDGVAPIKRRAILLSPNFEASAFENPALAKARLDHFAAMKDRYTAWIRTPENERPSYEAFLRETLSPN